MIYYDNNIEVITLDSCCHRLLVDTLCIAIAMLPMSYIRLELLQINTRIILDYFNAAETTLSFTVGAVKWSLINFW